MTDFKDLTLVKGELFFMTSGAYSDTQYHIYEALQDINAETLRPLIEFCDTHELVSDWQETIYPLHFMVLLERENMVKRLPIFKTISMNYSVNDIDFYDSDYAGDEIREAEQQIDKLGFKIKE